jgi:hypothetical protein
VLMVYGVIPKRLFKRATPYWGRPLTRRR